MSVEQRRLAVTKSWQYFGQVVGVIFGCFLGLCPLLWIDAEEAHRMKREKEQVAVLQTVVHQVAKLLSADAVGLLFVDPEQPEELVSRNCHNLPPFRWKLAQGFIGHVGTTGEFVNIADIHDEPMYEALLHDNLLDTGIRVQSLMAMPIFIRGMVQGVIVVINKEKGQAFSAKDEDILSAICSHISVAIADEKQTFEEVLDNCQRSMTQQGSPEWNISTQQRRKHLFPPVLNGISSVTGSEATALLLLDSRSRELYTEAVEGTLCKYRTKVGRGIAGRSVETGEVLNFSGSQLRELDLSGHRDSEGNNIVVKSALCVPIFDTTRKCIGAIECINKRNAEKFDTEEDVNYVRSVASHVALMVEGPDAGLKRVLAMTRQKLQHKGITEAKGDQHVAAVCFLEQAQNLPSRPDGKDNLMNPFVTFNVMRGDPLRNQVKEFQQIALRKRAKDRGKMIGDYAKSTVCFQDSDPHWNESLAVAMPSKLKGCPAEELYIHVLLWDYDAINQDRLVGQAAFPFSDMPRVAGKGARPCTLLPPPGAGANCGLANAKIWVSVNRAVS